MAARFDAATDVLTASTGIPSGDLTVAFWFNMSADRNDFSALFSIAASASNPSTYFDLLFDADGTSLRLWGSSSQSASVATTPGTWYRVAMTVTGTSGTIFAAAAGSALAQTGTASIGSMTRSNLFIGSNGYGEWFNGRIAGVKVYSAVLPPEEAEAELGTYQPQRTANLLRWHPFLTAELVDYSGAGNTLTAGSTATTTEDGPPIRWGRARGPRVSVATVPPVRPIRSTVLTQAALVRAHYW